MKILSKRVIAFLLALCLLPLGTIVPVLASESETVVAEKSVVYDFKYIDSAGLTKNQGNGAYASWSGDNAELLEKAYKNSTNSIPLYYSKNTDTENLSIMPDCIFIKGMEKGYIAVKIQSPGAGTYSMDITHVRNSSNTTDCHVYILPVGTTENAIAEGTALTDEAYVGNVNLYSKTLTNNVGTIKFELEAGTEYIVVFRAMGEGSKEGTYNIRVAELTLTKSCTSANDTVQEINNAPLDSEITLQAACDASGKAITVGAGVTLDLNGSALTAGEVQSAGAIIDSSTESTGLLTATSFTSTGDNGSYLPLKDETAGGYRLYKTVVEKLGVNDTTEISAKFWFHVSFENDKAYALADNISIGADLSWTDSGENEACANPEFVSEWETAVQANSNIDISLTVNGLNSEISDSFALTPMVKANGVTIQADALTLS